MASLEAGDYAEVPHGVCGDEPQVGMKDTAQHVVLLVIVQHVAGLEHITHK